MKYQHIVNDELLFETNNAGDFAVYILYDPKASQAKGSVLYNLLDKSNGYICNMVSVAYSKEKQNIST